MSLHISLTKISIYNKYHVAKAKVFVKSMCIYGTRLELATYRPFLLQTPDWECCVDVLSGRQRRALTSSGRVLTSLVSCRWNVVSTYTQLASCHNAVFETKSTCSKVSAVASRCAVTRPQGPLVFLKVWPWGRSAPGCTVCTIWTGCGCQQIVAEQDCGQLDSWEWQPLVNRATFSLWRGVSGVLPGGPLQK